jgi:hypothetical protein
LVKACSNYDGSVNLKTILWMMLMWWKSFKNQ